MVVRPKLVVLTGAGVSAESGLKTFRDSGGLWESYDVMDVASIDGWRRNPELVHRFYDERRKQAWDAQPNVAHAVLARLEKSFEVSIITQNVDRLHEKAGSTNVLHLHGDLFTARCSTGKGEIREIENNPLPPGLPTPYGGVWRPNVVWFGEPVPAMETAIELVEKADIFLIVGTSLQVYPAAGLLNYIRPGVPIWLADPNAREILNAGYITFFAKPATRALPEIEAKLYQHFGIASK